MLGGIKYNKDKVLATDRQFVQDGHFLIQPPYLITTALNIQPLFSNKLICIKVPATYVCDIRNDIIKYEDEDINKDLMIKRKTVLI